MTATIVRSSVKKDLTNNFPWFRVPTCRLRINSFRVPTCRAGIKSCVTCMTWLTRPRFFSQTWAAFACPTGRWKALTCWPCSCSSCDARDTSRSFHVLWSTRVWSATYAFLGGFGSFPLQTSQCRRGETGGQWWHRWKTGPMMFPSRWFPRSFLLPFAVVESRHRPIRRPASFGRLGAFHIPRHQVAVRQVAEAPEGRAAVFPAGGPALGPLRAHEGIRAGT